MSREKSVDKRQRILDAALRVFAERGFYTARVSEVARAAGVADGTIYLYFENKDDLLIKLFEDRMDFLIHRLNEDLQRTGGSCAERFRRLVHLHLVLATEATDLAEFITVELRQSQKFIKEYGNPRFQEYLSIIRSIIEAGQADASFRPELDARTVVRAMFGALDEALLALTLAHRRGRDVDVAKAATDLATLLLGGISND